MCRMWEKRKRKRREKARKVNVEGCILNPRRKTLDGLCSDVQCRIDFNLIYLPRNDIENDTKNEPGTKYLGGHCHCWRLVLQKHKKLPGAVCLTCTAGLWQRARPMVLVKKSVCTYQSTHRKREIDVGR
jgi:hypothetical protein